MHILVPSGGCRRGDSVVGFWYKGVVLDKCKISFFVVSSIGLGIFGLYLFFFWSQVTGRVDFVQIMYSLRYSGTGGFSQ